MEQINLEDNQKVLKSGDGKDGEGDFFHHQWKKIEKNSPCSGRCCAGYFLFGIWHFVTPP